MSVTAITEHADVVTLINVFVVQPSKQQALVDLLAEATEEVMRHRPGFVTANIHASTDGTKVVNYAQWRSEADFRAMLADAEAREHMARAETLVESFEPKLYRVVSTHHS